MRHTTTWICGLAVLLASVGISAASANASSTATRQPVALLTVNLGSATGDGVVSIAADDNVQVTGGGIVKTIDEVPVATVKVDGGGRHVLKVPITEAMENAAVGGYVNLQINAIFAERGAVASAWIEMPTRMHGALTTGENVKVDAYYKLAARSSSSADAGGSFARCQWWASGIAVQTARIGELHSASLRGAEAQFIYGGRIDSQFGVVYTDTSSTQGFRESGAATLSGQLGRRTVVTASDGTQEFVGARFIREEFVSSRNAKTGQPSCGAHYMAKFVTALAGAFRTGGRASRSPWRSCLKDPGGYAEIAAGTGFYELYKGPAKRYTNAARIFGVPIIGETNLTATVRLNWVDLNPTHNLYVCGRGRMPLVPVYYETAG